MPENLLLKNLPEEERLRLSSFLEPVEMKEKETLIAPNEPIRFVYFPEDCVTSTLQELSDGSSVEAGLMGVEGMIGIQLWLHSETTPSRTLVQVSGAGQRMRADDFRREVMDKRSPLNDLVARYTHVFLVMTSQTAACNRLHEVDARLCRWLKMIHNRVDRNEFMLRQEFIAAMLGVHRPTLSIAAGMLQKAGYIEYSRGRMRILDPEGLRASACECYAIIEDLVGRLYPDQSSRMEKDVGESQLAD